MPFKAIYLSQTEAGRQTEIVTLEPHDLDEGEVTVAVEYSTINYKDGLALTHKSPVVRRFPLIAGIDFAGTVTESSHPDFKAGDRVTANGWDLGFTHHGGLSQLARVPAKWLIKLPDSITTREAAAIGTAGYTAMLGVLALQQHGTTPDKGEVLVTGAGGGVGSVAVALLAELGYRVTASTGRMHEADYLHKLGANEIIDRSELDAPSSKPLLRERWVAAIDSAGSHTLANILAQTRYGGIVACNGLAQGADLVTTVMPFILRGVTLAGIDSVYAPVEKRRLAWEGLARYLDRNKLAEMINEYPLGKAVEVAQRILKGEIRGRTVINVNA
ncbi:hypothetical protein PL75_06840 [Neisseria arctica]|uniref:Enoyl reductase (ER) domain-containing protein n=1 Tax=Neisseria arctica TaxID=1470200 RepID=A0A0J0YRM8_9NEIS|nr:MDR family oxidoreductase [Neisseria arctica]KLT72786.1 hypothetical protein PL75_06840 [Neisseria arctica]UOO87285.1 oxidoreductase [Neisseria arctica]